MSERWVIFELCDDGLWRVHWRVDTLRQARSGAQTLRGRYGRLVCVAPAGVFPVDAYPKAAHRFARAVAA